LQTNQSVIQRTAITVKQHKTCFNPDHKTKREVDGTYQQVESSSAEQAIEGAKRTEGGTEGLSEINRKQGVAAGLKGPN
jgi:hypothetical protein